MESNEIIALVFILAISFMLMKIMDKGFRFFLIILPIPVGFVVWSGLLEVWVLYLVLIMDLILFYISWRLDNK